MGYLKPVSGTIDFHGDAIVGMADAPHRAARHRLRARGEPGVRRSDRRGEHRAADLDAPAGPRREDAHRSRLRDLSRSCASTRRAAATSSRAASARWCRSRARSRSIRSCCCSTSRSRACRRRSSRASAKASLRFAASATACSWPNRTSTTFPNTPTRLYVLERGEIIYQRQAAAMTYPPEVMKVISGAACIVQQEACHAQDPHPVADRPVLARRLRLSRPRDVASAMRWRSARRLEAFEAKTGGPLKGDLRHKSHLLFSWLARPRAQRPRSSTRSRISTGRTCSAGRRTSSSRRRTIRRSSPGTRIRPTGASTSRTSSPPGSRSRRATAQRRDGLHPRHAHRATRFRIATPSRKNNLLTRGQEVAVDVDESQGGARSSSQPGEMSLHHVRLVHGSPPNPSNDRRIGFAIRYIPDDAWRRSPARTARRSCAASTRSTTSSTSRGPARDMDPAFVALHRQITERNAQILYRGTAVKSYNDPKALPDRAS